MRVSELKAANYNPRKIKDDAFEGLKISLDQFGDLSGITFNKRTNTLVAGHQRVKAIQEAYGDLFIVPLNEEEGFIEAPGRKIFKVRFVDWSIEMEKAANIAANSETISGEFTEDVKLVLEDIRLGTPDIYAELMFDRVELPTLDLYQGKIQEDGFDFEAEVEKIKEPKTKAGDLYQLGPHRLLCGDSTLKVDADKLLGDEKGKLIFTDPPYNVDYKSPGGASYNSEKFGGTGGRIFNDNKSDQDCLQFYSDVLKNLFDHSADDVTLYWWFANKNHVINRIALENTSWHMSQVIIWLKNSFVFSRGQDYHRCYEPCMLGWKSKQKHFKTTTLNNLSDVFSLDFQKFEEQLDVWYSKRDVTSQYIHPTQKPLRLPERAIKKNSNVNDIVIDFFGGSGSTLMACEQLSRNARLIELDPKFCDAIVTRYLRFKGSDTVIVNNEKLKWEANNGN